MDFPTSFENKICKLCQREMRRNRVAGGRTVFAPTLYSVLISAEDEQTYLDSLVFAGARIEKTLIGFASADGIIMDGHPLVRFIRDNTLRHGAIDVIAEVVAASLLPQLREEEALYYRNLTGKPMRPAALNGRARSRALPDAPAARGGALPGASAGAPAGASARTSSRQNFAERDASRAATALASPDGNAPAPATPAATRPSAPRSAAKSDARTRSTGTLFTNAGRESDTSAPIDFASAPGTSAGAAAVASSIPDRASVSACPASAASAAPATPAAFPSASVAVPAAAPTASAPTKAGASATPGASASAASSAPTKAAVPAAPGAPAPSAPAPSAPASSASASAPAPTRPAPGAQLFCLKDTSAKRTYPLRGARIVIGRGNTCDIVLADANASRVHAEVSRIAGDIISGDVAWLISDCGSTNGTKVNGHETESATLRLGDVITIGTTRLVFDTFSAGNSPSREATQMR